MKMTGGIFFYPLCNLAPGAAKNERNTGMPLVKCLFFRSKCFFGWRVSDLMRGIKY